MDSERLGDRSMIFFAELVLIVIGLIAIGIGIIFNNVVTRKRVILNQKECDEYCKGMTDDEKREAFFSWCEENKAKHCWPHYYYPCWNKAKG